MSNWKIKLDIKGDVPLYKQIIAAVINDIEKGVLQKNEMLPSINEFSAEYEVARDTVEKAYKELKEKGMLKSVRGKGYFVGDVQGTKLRVLLIMNKLSAYKKIIYYSFINALGDKAVVDLQVHHYNALLLKKLLDDNLGKYHYYVIMPHFYEELDKVNILEEIERIPKDELVLLDRNLPGVKGNYLAVYQDFENDIYDTLEGALQSIKKYKQMGLVFPVDGNYPEEIMRGFRKFCNHYSVACRVFENSEEISIEKGWLYIVVEETDLTDIVKQSITRRYTLGKDIGLISFNETTLKQVLAGGITTISTHFEAMGATTAALILDKHCIHVRNPFSMIRRSSL